MLLGRSNANSRGRGQSPSRSRGSSFRGRGATSRGASSSSKDRNVSYPAEKGWQPRPGLAPKVLSDKTNTPHGSDRGRGRYQGKNFDPNFDLKKAYLNSQIGAELNATTSRNPFDRERAENAAKREQKGHTSTSSSIMVNGGGRGRGSKQVRFLEQPSDEPAKREASPANSNPLHNPFGPSSATSTTSSSIPYNPFAPKTSASPMSSSNTNSAPFNPFATTATAPLTNSTAATTPYNPFATSAPNSSSTTNTSKLFNPFASSAPTSSTKPFGTSAASAPANPFDGPFAKPFTAQGFGIASASTSVFGTPSASAPFKPAQVPRKQPSVDTQPAPSKQQLGSQDEANIQQLLRSRGILPPAWPKDPGNPKQRSAMETTYHAHKGYQSKARTFLMKEGKLDDPDKPKLLSEAINFKGTCEDMCPEFEKITRIVEHDVPNAEKEDAPDGSRWPAPHKMIKALARSAAGQDAPLPEDVRTPAALKRTFDYLIHDVLGDNGNLRKEHGYIWNRTRAIRRDFVFQESSMTSADLLDQVYCLEGITRFHVIALHQMSKVLEDGIAAEDFSEQQEVEQLGKALLSLVQTYDDCKEREIVCENEAEFRAYYVLINSRNPAVLEQVQDWGIEIGGSEVIKIALSLAETLQNIWDVRGPLKPHSATDVAWNAYSRFFTILKDKSVSYTMACFAEIFFNDVRKAALRTILASYRKQRDQTKDWTLPRLNEYLVFDDEEDIIPFGEAYGLRFDEIDGEPYLSFESTDQISDPFPPLKQPHSDYLVEYKRGSHTIPQVIDMTVYYEGDENEEISDDEDGETEDGGAEDEMFIKESGQSTTPAFIPEEDGGDVSADDSVPTQEKQLAGNSLFDRITALPGKTITAAFPGLFQKPAASPFQSPMGTPLIPEQNATPPASASIFDQKPASKSFSDIFKQPTSAAPVKQDFSSLFDQKKPTTEKSPTPIGTTLGQSPSSQARPSFSFTSTPVSQAVGTAPSLSWSIGQHAESPVVNDPSQPLSTSGSHGFMSPATETGKTLPTTDDKNGGETPSPAQFSQPPAMLGPHAIAALPNTATLPKTIPPGQSSAQPVWNAPAVSANNGQSLSGIQSPSAQDLAPKQQMNPFDTTVLSPRTSKLNMDTFSKWVVEGDDGIRDQFAEFVIGNVLKQTFDFFQQEQQKQKTEEAAEQARNEADHFRYISLATKYGQKWRENAHFLWMRRQGRRARQARQEMAEASFRASQAAKSADVVEDFKASTSKKRRSMELEATEVDRLPMKKRRSMDSEEVEASTSRKRQSVEVDESDINPAATKKRRGSLESLLHASGVLDGVHNLDDHIRRIVREELPEATNKRHKSSRSTNSPSSSTSKKRRDDPLRRSILSDPSYLSGESRLHLMEKYSVFDEFRKQTSGVQTDYFRLKARGITTLPNGSPLASSVAKDVLRHKRSLDGISKLSTPKMSKEQLVARSVPAKLAERPELPLSSAERDEDIQVLKAKAKVMMEKDNEARLRKKRSLEFDEDEEALFAKARRLRQQMDEDSAWLRAERERQSSGS